MERERERETKKIETGRRWRGAGDGEVQKPDR